MNFKKISKLIVTSSIIVMLMGSTANATSILDIKAISQDLLATNNTGTSLVSPFDITFDTNFGLEESNEESESESATESETQSMTAGAGVVDPIALDLGDETEDNSDEDASGEAYGYTNLGVANVTDHLNIREGEDDSSKIVGKMSPNAGCEVLEVVGNKARIASGSVEGYVSLDFLLIGDAALRRADRVVENLATVTADGLKLRETPSLDAEVKGMVAYGEELVVVKEMDEWVLVTYDEENVYVSAQYVSVGRKLKTALNMTEFLYGEGVSDIRVELCEYAKQFIGNPYVWGGTSLTKGTDCSGFVMSVFKNYGISLPRTSRSQAGVGTTISMSEARPGDLVFYAKGGSINHVAIYIGGGQVVHASNPKTGIRISNAYYRTPHKVVRVLQD